MMSPQSRHLHGRRSASDDELIRRFVASFERLDGLEYWQSATLPAELAAEPDVDDGQTVRWRPAVIVTDREQLAPIYQKLPGRFPALYERLVLTHRWIEVDLQTVRLLANPPGSTLSGLLREIFRDQALADVLIPAGFVPFGKATDVNYDPICFDLNSRQGDDCPVIQFEHETILCHGTIGERRRRAASFRELVCETIDLADSRPQ
jgi:hypothetical protein